MARLRRPPVVLTVKETSEILRINRPKVYDLIKGGILEGFKVGSDWRVKTKSVERLTGPIGHLFAESTDKDAAA